ncbi:MAG: hypothetical protein V7745_07545 [Pseudomonadales bacterium]
MKKTTQHIILALSITTLFGCNQPSNTETNTDTPAPTTLDKPIVNKSNLDLSLPDDTVAEQRTITISEKPLISDLFNSDKTPSKYQIDGQVLLGDEPGLGIKALDGAKVGITIKQ